MLMVWKKKMILQFANKKYYTNWDQGKKTLKKEKIKT